MAVVHTFAGIQPIAMTIVARLLLLFCFFLPFGNSTAQELHKCGADELRISTLRQMPTVAGTVGRREAELERFTADFKRNDAARGGQQIYTIPVVFHVIHQYGTENISDAQLMDGLSVCNATFRKTYPDTADIIEAFRPIHADCGIEFRLATKDPDGNCHPGINRIASQLGITGDHAVKSLVHWDPERYLNVYVVSSAAGLAGHAVWPSDADTIPQWDGIVLAHSYVGSIGTSDQQRSVVFAHEVGHYLNLHHIWGGNNVPGFYYLPVAQPENCDHDDLVDDTPNTIGWQTCNLNGASCGNVVDNVQNAMDYTYCNVMFTEGQRDRMRACLNSPIAGRNNLWQESNLISTGVIPGPAPLCAADFTADPTTVCPNTDNQVIFTSASYHGTVDSLRWTFPGGDPSTSAAAAPVVTYTDPGLHDASLRAYRNGEMVEVVKTGFISVISDQQVPFPFAESFEESPSLDGPLWARGIFDGQSRWTLTDDAATSGTQSVSVNNWDSGLYTRDELYSPPIDLTGATQMRVAFKYAFAGRQPATSTDRLVFQVSRNCETSWSVRLMLTGSQLETAPAQDGPFLPQVADWQQASINIPSQYLTEGFRFRFGFTSAGGNRLFIDDINIDINASVAETGVLPEMKLFPNPASDRLLIELNALQATDALMDVTDLAGRKMVDTEQILVPSGRSTHGIELGGIKAGMYLLRVISTDATVVRPFVKQ
ncbi:MAG: T9SS type A sorting domain-containing protein [Flavobacteriales bacterium]|nr:T9SS type A sorting domain-containing protein [Flavobacteriales bacterium]